MGAHLNVCSLARAGLEDRRLVGLLFMQELQLPRAQAPATKHVYFTEFSVGCHQWIPTIAFGYIDSHVNVIAVRKGSEGCVLINVATNTTKFLDSHTL